MARTRTTVHYPGTHHVPPPHYPGYTHHPHHPPAQGGYTRSVSQRPGDGSPGFFWIQPKGQNTTFSQNHHFFLVKNRPVKTCTFRKNPYLILITFVKNVILAFLTKITVFETPLVTPLFWLVFSLFSRYQVFPRKLVILVKYIYISRNNGILALFAKMSPTDLMSGKWHFSVGKSALFR